MGRLYFKAVCKLISTERFKKKLKKIKRKGERQKAKYELESRYTQYYPSKNGKKVSNIMLAIVVTAIVGYVVAAFWLQNNTSVEISPTLTTCWFAFWSAEVLALAGIKITKVVKQPKEEPEECEYEEELG